jgi:4-hydroxythreonine-4-phosphate dehydrogenase
MDNMQAVIAISIGDIGGIGPEVVLKAFAHSSLFEVTVPVLFAPPQYLARFQHQINSTVDIRIATFPEEPAQGVLNIIPVTEPGTEYTPGKPSVEAGSISLEAIEKAAELCISGKAAALVTAPISKESIGLAGSPYKGHTDLLRDLTGSNEVLMVLASPSMRVSLATVHIPLFEVPAAICLESVQRTIELSRDALVRDFGIDNPRIAVLGLNPHAGDGGFLGREELDIIGPAIQTSAANGIQVYGPFPADGFFSAYGDSNYDLIVAMYHDQGLIPLKMSAEGRAVNVTCELPIVRTSPDHGTAFDIAGSNTADPGSFIEAVRTALHISEHRLHATEAGYS